MLATAVALGLGISACGRLDPHRALAIWLTGNTVVDGQGQPIRLVGVDRSGGEYACIEGQGFFPGPTNVRSISAMLSWRIKVVRLPLNEDCWLGINGVPARYSGLRYQAAVRGYAARLNRAGLYVILDLHWNAPGRRLATGQQPMADLDHAPSFWSSVARTLRDDPAVIFDLYNEPHGISWQCWRSGCLLPAGWRAAGMQTLVDAVRATGARQPIILSGLGFGNDLSSWFAYRPHDPADQLMAGFHAYDSRPCGDVTCWQREVAPLARHVPVLTTELGAVDCSAAFTDLYMTWADSEGLAYLGWSWNPYGCGGPALITSWAGDPTAFGGQLRAHLLRPLTG